MEKLFNLFLFSILITSTISIHGQDNNDFYKHSIMPGSEEWLQVDDYYQRLELLNIPEDTLKKMNTFLLMNTCLNYPQFELLFTRNDLISGIAFMSNHFNGFRELYERKDAGKELLKKYKKMNSLEYKQFSNDSKGNLMVEFIKIELFLGHPMIIENMNSKEKYELLNEAYNKYEEKAASWKQLSEDNLAPNLRIMIQILEIERGNEKINDSDKTGFESIIKKCKIQNINDIETVINNSLEYINEKK